MSVLGVMHPKIGANAPGDSDIKELASPALEAQRSRTEQTVYTVLQAMQAKAEHFF
jgi:hypothetical protein